MESPIRISSVIIQPFGLNPILEMKSQEGAKFLFEIEHFEFTKLITHFMWLVTEARNPIVRLEPLEVTVFETESASAAAIMGGALHGAVLFQFNLPDETAFVTALGPVLASLLCQSLDSALSALAVRPENRKKADNPLDTRGKEPQFGNLVEHFGQKYPVEILQALGLLMLRANNLEKALISVLACLLDSSRERAMALFYSTVNARARTDMITALIDHSDLTEMEKVQLSHCLKESQSAASQRNDLVHGHWVYKGLNFSVEVPRKSGGKVTTIHVTEQSIHTLAALFYSAGSGCEGLAKRIDERRAIARNTATTPSDGEPSSKL